MKYAYILLPFQFFAAVKVQAADWLLVSSTDCSLFFLFIPTFFCLQQGHFMAHT